MQLIRRRRRRLGRRRCRRRRRRRRRRRHCHHRRRQLQHRVRSTARVVDVMPVSVSWMHGCCLGERVGLTVVRANCELQSHSVQSSATGSKFNSSPTRRRRFQTVKAGRWRLAGWRWSLSCCLSGGVAVTALVRLRRRHSLPAAARQREREREREEKTCARTLSPRMAYSTRSVAGTESVSQSESHGRWLVVGDVGVIAVACRQQPASQPKSETHARTPPPGPAWRFDKISPSAHFFCRSEYARRKARGAASKKNRRSAKFCRQGRRAAPPKFFIAKRVCPLLLHKPAID